MPGPSIMMAGQRWYSKVYDPPLYPETGAVRDFVVRHGGDVADSVSLGGSILWGGATLGTGWFAGEAITAGGRLTIDGAMDGDPESIVKGAIKLAEGVMEAADIDVSEAIGDALDDTPAPSGDVAGGAENAAVDGDVTVSKGRFPETAQHIEDAQANGKPKTLTVDRASTATRRRQSLGGVNRVPGMDRDEYPPAMFKEGGSGASVRPVTPSDNRGAGACIGAQCRNLPDGSRVKIKVTK